MWTLKYLSLRHIRTGEWTPWDLNPGPPTYEVGALTYWARGPHLTLLTTPLYIMYYNITSKFCQQIFLLFSSFFLLSSLITLTILPHITKFVNTFFLFFFNFLIFIILYYIRWYKLGFNYLYWNHCFWYDISIHIYLSIK